MRLFVAHSGSARPTITLHRIVDVAALHLLLDVNRFDPSSESSGGNVVSGHSFVCNRTQVALGTSRNSKHPWRCGVIKTAPRNIVSPIRMENNFRRRRRCRPASLDATHEIDPWCLPNSLVSISTRPLYRRMPGLLVDLPGLQPASADCRARRRANLRHCAAT